MSDFQLFIVLALLLIVIFSLILTKKFHASLHHSQRMVISMISGTSIGLVIGLMLGSLFQGNLFISTVLSISAGAFIGGVCNWKLGMVSCIEGLSAGLMGGMMGAMLGEMISITESIILIKLFITLAVCSLFLYPMFACTSCPDQSIPSKKWFLKPILLFLLVISFLLGGSWFVSEPTHQKTPHIHHSS
ncbi:hypothetical protein ACJA3J_02760 [Halobacillus sp. SY10]|uniref:hypothetical protein n=1 Tax=Bacillaceae TaxID=186817 RepID=UPI0012959524|nr:hypothetical protein [Sediminibacillus terrae]